MVSSDRPVSLEDEVSHSMKEMIGGCCVCSDERGWAENPLVYCDGHGCSVAVHQGKHPTARRAEPGPLPTVTASPTGAATASSPAPPPPRPVPRPGVDSAGPRRGAAGVGCACGRKCVWPGLSCDSALTLSSVIWPPPAPGPGGLESWGPWLEEGAAGLREGVECGGRQGLPPSVGLPWRWVRARVDPSPFGPAPSRLPQCVWGLPVAWKQPGNAAPRSGAWGRGPRSCLAAGDRGGEASAAAPPAFWRRLRCCGPGARCGRRAEVAPQWCCCRSAWLHRLGLRDVFHGQIRPLPQHQ